MVRYGVPLWTVLYKENYMKTYEVTWKDTYEQRICCGGLILANNILRAATFVMAGFSSASMSIEENKAFISFNTKSSNLPITPSLVRIKKAPVQELFWLKINQQGWVNDVRTFFMSNPLSFTTSDLV